MARRLIGRLLLVFLAINILGGILRRGAHHAALHHHHRAVAAEQAAQTQATGADTAGEQTMNAEYAAHHHRGAHHRHSGGFFFLPKLLFLGLGALFLTKILRYRRHGHHHGHRGSRAEQAEADASIADDIILNPDAQPEPSTKAVDELTREDLLLAMKRLGIDKLEL